MENPPKVAERFGSLVAELATRAGYDLTSGAGGRAALTRDIGTMSPSAVGRMLDGKTLPMPHQYEGIARAVGADPRTLLVEGGVISSEAWPDRSNRDVLSATRTEPLSPEAAADAWGITDPMIRSMLISNIEQAIRLQRTAETQDNLATGGP